MRTALALFFQLALVSSAFAQTSAAAPPPDAAKEGGAQGDPRGAIRSMGGVGNGSKKPVEGGVKVPDYVGHIGHAADQIPPGTSRPGSGPTYVAPR